MTTNYFYSYCIDRNRHTWYTITKQIGGRYMKISLGGYNLQGYVEFNGEETIGFMTDLYKGDLYIAKVLDEGENGDIEVTISEYLSEEEKQTVLEDFNQLLHVMDALTDLDAPILQYTHSSGWAIEGFTHLLIQLNALIDFNDSIRCTSEDTYYFTGMFGDSLFKSVDRDEINYLGVDTGTSDFNEAIKIIADFTEATSKKYGSLVTALILRGDRDWNLTFEEYLDLNDN